MALCRDRSTGSSASLLHRAQANAPAAWYGCVLRVCACVTQREDASWFPRRHQQAKISRQGYREREHIATEGVACREHIASWQH